MRINGLALLVECAVSSVQHPLVSRYERGLLLGALREDVAYLPLLGTVFEHLSLSHLYGPSLPGGFIPFLSVGPRWKAQRFFVQAVRAHQRGRTAEGFVRLGRALHLVADMACPVHVHRYLHDTDGFEWYLEAHRSELRDLPRSKPPSAKEPAEIIESLARFTSQYRGDPTQNAIGRRLKRWGWLRAVPRQELRSQALAILPVAIAHAARLIQLYLQRTGIVANFDGD